MHNSIAVKVLDGDSNLVRQLFHSLLTELEISELDVIEEILSLHVFKDYIVVVRILKKIDKGYDVRML